MRDLFGLGAAVFSVTLLIPSVSAYTPGVAPATTSCTYVATAPYSVTVSWAADAGRPKTWNLIPRDAILGVTPEIASGRVAGSAGTVGYETYAIASDPSNSTIVLGNRNGYSADLACTAAVAAAPAAPAVTDASSPVIEAAPAVPAAPEAAPAVTEVAPSAPEVAPTEAPIGQ